MVCEINHVVRTDQGTNKEVRKAGANYFTNTSNRILLEKQDLLKCERELLGCFNRMALKLKIFPPFGAWKNIQQASEELITGFV